MIVDLLYPPPLLSLSQGRTLLTQKKNMRSTALMSLPLPSPLYPLCPLFFLFFFALPPIHLLCGRWRDGTGSE